MVEETIVRSTDGLSKPALKVMVDLFGHQDQYMLQVADVADIREHLRNGKITRVRNCGKKTYLELCRHYGVKPLEILQNGAPRRLVDPAQCPTCGQVLSG
jgi:hypothetical protein